ncbi:hypothetical protein CNR22_18065 [Sphingobacteriaceae bacterium]|nr:hypothetical protein CNR22_18065 [Sphingobacteriaceae bacterium]
MEIIYKATLGLHIGSGFLALLCGLISIVSKKGGKMHRTSGKVFFYAMLGVCFTSVYISLVKDNSFLLVVGIFSFYLNYFGFMALKNKTLRPKLLDWLVIAITAINSFFMVYSMNVVLMVFGGIGFYAIVLNLRTSIHVLQNKELPDLFWLRRHIGMMTGAFIATATAFLVVNSDSLKVFALPGWLLWLLPTFLLVPLIFYYNKKYTGKKQTPNSFRVRG